MENDMLVWTSVVWFWFSNWFLVTQTAGFELWKKIPVPELTSEPKPEPEQAPS
jgi:hypothetical protein